MNLVEKNYETIILTEGSWHVRNNIREMQNVKEQNQTHKRDVNEA